MRGGFGDEAVLEEGVVNPDYEEERYGNYSETTRKNLVGSRVDVMDVVIVFIDYFRVWVLVLVSVLGSGVCVCMYLVVLLVPVFFFGGVFGGFFGFFSRVGFVLDSFKISFFIFVPILVPVLGFFSVVHCI